MLIRLRLVWNEVQLFIKKKINVMFCGTCRYIMHSICSILQERHHIRFLWQQYCENEDGMKTSQSMNGNFWKQRYIEFIVRRGLLMVPVVENNETEGGHATSEIDRMGFEMIV